MTVAGSSFEILTILNTLIVNLISLVETFGLYFLVMGLLFFCIWLIIQFTKLIIRVLNV